VTATNLIHPGAAQAAPPSASVQAATVFADIPTPEDYFGFQIGSDGNLAQWNKMVRYFRTVGDRSNRVIFEETGRTTLNNPFVTLTISSPANLANLDKLLKINDRLADPRGLSPADAERLAKTGKPFYFVQAGIHSTEVGNSQATIEWAYRLAAERSDYIEKILDELVIVLVPCQNPDGLVLVNDYFVQTAGTSYSRTYPDLYHKYTGHDDNRDWFMLSQIETRLNVTLQNKYHPQVFQDSHQAGSGAPRMFTPPYLTPNDPNIDTITVQQTNLVGMAMQRAMTAAGMKGTQWGSEYDYWSPSRQYIVYHGTTRILTEAASCANLAYPQTGTKPLGQQTIDINFIEPYDQKTWTLRQIVDYVSVAFYAGIEEVAYDSYNFLKNFYRVGVKATTRTAPYPYAYVIAAGQRDPQAVLDTLEILHAGAVEIQQAKAAFTAGGKNYPAGSYIVQLNQPYGGFAKTLLEVQDYPQLLQYPGGPPQRPYDVTAQTLPMLLGFDADLIADPFTASTRALTSVTPPAVQLPPAPPSTGAYTFGPESYGVFKIVAQLQKQNIPTYRAAAAFTDGGRTFPIGTFLVPPTAAARKALEGPARSTGIPITAISKVPSVAGVKFKPGTKIGLLKPPDNMPSGWLMWQFDQYGVDYAVVKADDYANLAKFDAIVMPDGVSKNSITNGLSRTAYPPEWSWAFGVGTDGWNKLHDYVTAGGTLVAFGSGTATAQSLFGLPITSVLPTDDNVFYCPGSLLSQEFDTTDPVAWGIEANNPVWFNEDRAYKLTDTTTYPVKVVSKYPDSGDQLQSGWLIGGESLNGAANTLSWTVGSGSVVTFASEVSFRTWNRAETRMIFNSMYYGPAGKLTAAQFAKLP
jgi:Zinc carboxypeptidase